MVHQPEMVPLLHNLIKIVVRKTLCKTTDIDDTAYVPLRVGEC